jgi:hypothetical protein
LWGSGPASIPELERYPTVIASSAGPTSEIGQSLLGLLDHFQWKRVSIMLDAVHPRVENIMDGIIVAFIERVADFDILTTKLNSKVDVNPYPVALTKSAGHSRSLCSPAFIL